MSSRAGARIGAKLLQAPVSEVRLEKAGHVISAVGPYRGRRGRAHLVPQAAGSARPTSIPLAWRWSAGYKAARDTGTFSYAAHAAVVAVDPETGDVEILDYVVVEDGGTLVNPMIVDGQILGGLAQGIGTALYEEMRLRRERPAARLHAVPSICCPARRRCRDIRIDAHGDTVAIYPLRPEGAGRRRCHCAAGSHNQCHQRCSEGFWRRVARFPRNPAAHRCRDQGRAGLSPAAGSCERALSATCREGPRVIPLSILDQSVAIADKSHGQSIRNTIALAQAAEAMGYSRFWVSEHHNHGSIVGTAPEVLLGAIASQTASIRVGSAGVMLPHYSPYHVAEQFRVLDAIAPGRIDLGVGRAPGSDGRTAFALNPQANERPQYFPADIRDMLAWLKGAPLMDGHPFQQVKAFPAGETVPEVWVLGSSDYGAQVAAHFGLPYAFAWFFTDGRGGKQAIDIYKQTYKPSERHPEPHAAICVWALAAATQEEAEFQYGPRAHTRLLRDVGVFAPLEPPEIIAKHEYNEAERSRIAQQRATALIGTPKMVGDGIRQLAAELGVDEVAVVTWTYDEAVRIESYRLLADELGLLAPSPRSV